MSLYSERKGAKRTYNTMQLHGVIKDQLREPDMVRLLVEKLGGSIPLVVDSDNGKTVDYDTDGCLSNRKAFFRRRLVHDMEFCVSSSERFLHNLPKQLSPVYALSIDMTFDFLEVLYELVSEPRTSPITKRITFSSKTGQRLFREIINPDLALYEVPHQMLSNGQIVEISSKPVTELTEQMLQIIETDAVSDSIANPVNSAVTNYIKRGATISEKKNAVRELADALESIRPSVKEHLLSADEKDLFRIANQFSIRHNNSGQKSEYDKSIWYDWMFHVNLAALLTTIRILQE